MTPQEFGQTVKAKFPQYADVDDVELANMVVKKYPQYKSQIVQPEQASQNNGTGFNPTFESEEDDTALQSVGKTIGNTPKSGFMLGKDVVTAVTNPIDTGKAVVGLVKGAGGKLAEKTLEETEIGQGLLQKMSDMRVSNGLEPLQTDATGKLQAATTEEVETVNKVTDYFKARYGSWSKFKDSVVEDPVGVLSDIATAVTGGGAAIKQVGNVSKLSNVTDAGAVVQRAGNAMEPLSAASGVAGAGADLVTNNTLSRAVGEAVPTASRIAESQVVKALDLTQGDIARITQKTGNNVTDFMVKNNVFKETPEEIVLALDDLKTTRMADVRRPIGQVKTVYQPTDVPRVSDALTVVQQSIDGVPGLESVATEVNALLAKPNYTLSDVQRAKEILDQNSSIFNRMGDARQTATAEGLANIRGELRSFIEKEVKVNTGVDIRPLNNDVATAVEIADAVETRATRGMTRQGVTVFDGILGFSAAAAFDPVTALGVVTLKKLSETPSFRIAMARQLTKTPVQDLNKWASEIASGKISPATKQSLSNLIETAKTNAQYIETGSQVVDEAQKPTETEAMR